MKAQALNNSYLLLGPEKYLYRLIFETGRSEELDEK